MTVESTISRADEEIANDRLWRAKEILGSSISTYGYSRKLFHALARVLLKMGDELEAGKYFLLSIDAPSDTELNAINVFLARCNDQNCNAMLAKFPAAARVENRDGYPEYLRNHLANIGAPQILAQRTNINSNQAYDRLFLIGCSVFAFAITACTIVGAYTILSWFWNAQ